MGLDISHCKATLERPLTTNPDLMGGITRENYYGFNAPFDYFEKYIQLIDCPNILNTVIIVKNKNNFEEVKNWFKDYEYKIFINENEEEFDKQLIEYEKTFGLEKFHKYFDHLIQGEKWIVLSYYEFIKNEGFYYKEVGEQRKGMNQRFWRRFSSDQIHNFVHKDDFEYAYSCIDYYWENDTREDFELRKQNFKKNFIDNFEPGASFLSLSY